MKRRLVFLFLNILLFTSTSVAKGKGEINRLIGFAANGASFGTYLQGIESEVLRLHAEMELRKAEWLKELQKSSQRDAQKGLETFEAQTKELLERYETTLRRAQTLRIAIREAFDVCVGWQKKSVMGQLTFQNLLEDLELRGQMDLDLRERISDRCERHEDPVCVLAQEVSSAMAEQEIQAGLVQTITDQIEKSRIEKICHSLGEESISSLQQQELIKVEIQRLKNRLNAIQLKMKGYSSP